MDNLFDALNEEISRNEKLLKVYQSIPNGVFGAIMIKESLEKAKKARSEMDTIKMIESYKELKETN